jgi:hypothetical protein
MRRSLLKNAVARENARGSGHRAVFIVAALTGALAGSSMVRSFAAGDCQEPTWQINLVSATEPSSEAWPERASLTVSFGTISFSSNADLGFHQVTAHP